MMRSRSGPWPLLRQALRQLPVCCALFLIYLETVLILGLFGSLEWRGYLVALAFSCAGGCLIAWPALFFRLRVRRWLLILLWSLATILFMAQTVYYSLFTTFFSLYSVSAGGVQVMQFWRAILDTIGRNWLLMLILLMPLLLLIIFARRVLDFSPVRSRRQAGVLLAALLFILTGLALLQLPSPACYTPRQLYTQTFSSALCVREFGLLTAIRLDLRRLIFGSDDLADLSLADPTATSDDDDQTNPEIDALNHYFQSIAPTPENDYTGLFRGKNLILIVAESFSPLAVRADTTPTLYRLFREGMNFSHFYTPIWPVSTSDGEYTTNLSLIPSDRTWSMTASANLELPFTMGRLLQNQGYRTLAYHNHLHSFYQRNLSHPNMGYQAFKAVGSGLAITDQWPESDLEMIRATTGDYLGSGSFVAYYMTVSGHLEYNRSNAMVRKNWSAAEDLPFSTAVRSYLACNMELDKALQALIEALEESGQAEDTVIALCADHYPYGLSRQQIDELAGRGLDPDFDLFANAFLLWHQGIEPMTVDVPGSNLDILPTLANLFGLTYDSRLLMGRDMFADTDHLVIFANRSWLNSRGRFNALTGQFTAEPGQTALSADEVRRICRQVDARFAASSLILENNYYGSLNYSIK